MEFITITVHDGDNKKVLTFPRSGLVSELCSQVDSFRSGMGKTSKANFYVMTVNEDRLLCVIRNPGPIPLTQGVEYIVGTRKIKDTLYCCARNIYAMDDGWEEAAKMAELHGRMLIKHQDRLANPNLPCPELTTMREGIAAMLGRLLRGGRKTPEPAQANREVGKKMGPLEMLQKPEWSMKATRD